MDGIKYLVQICVILQFNHSSYSCSQFELDDPNILKLYEYLDFCPIQPVVRSTLGNISEANPPVYDCNHNDKSTLFQISSSGYQIHEAPINNDANSRVYDCNHNDKSTLFQISSSGYQIHEAPINNDDFQLNGSTTTLNLCVCDTKDSPFTFLEEMLNITSANLTNATLETYLSRDMIIKLSIFTIILFTISFLLNSVKQLLEIWTAIKPKEPSIICLRLKIMVEEKITYNRLTINRHEHQNVASVKRMIADHLDIKYQSSRIFIEDGDIEEVICDQSAVDVLETEQRITFNHEGELLWGLSQTTTPISTPTTPHPSTSVNEPKPATTSRPSMSANEPEPKKACASSSSSAKSAGGKEAPKKNAEDGNSMYKYLPEDIRQKLIYLNKMGFTDDPYSIYLLEQFPNDFDKAIENLINYSSV